MTAPRPQPGWSLSDWLHWLEQGARGGILLGLDRVAAVHGRLGLRPRPTLTVAGTNGKGSCAHAAEALARATGQRTGLYTSPHLLHFGERIRVDGAPASDDAIVAALGRVEAARDGVELTYFEFTTLAAFCLFDSQNVDLRILEVGLGGRLDAVNIIDAEACVITSIGLDHTRELGDSLQAIAVEKAGVARAGSPAIVAQHPAPDGLEAALAAHGARIIALPALESRQARWRLPGWPCWVPAPAQGGHALKRNIAAAVEALAAMGVSVEQLHAALPKVVASLRIPGRMQLYGDLLLDVAHNEAAAQELVASVSNGQRWHIVLGMLGDKPVEAVAAALARLSPEIHCASLAPPRGLSSSALTARVAAAGVSGVDAGSVAEAIQQARTAGAEHILVTGSFLTVAEALVQ